MENRTFLSATYLVKAVSNKFAGGGHVTSTVADNTAVYGPADANGFIAVTADSEIDAINKGIVASATSTTTDHTPYQFYTGTNSNKFSVTAAPANDGLNYVLNLQNGTYLATDTIQVRPKIESFTAFDATYPDDLSTDTPPAIAGQSPTPSQLTLVSDPVSGQATLHLNGTLSADDATHRARTKWTLTSRNNTVFVASGSLSADGSDTVITLPNDPDTTGYLLSFGYDMNGDGALAGAGASEQQRLIRLHVVPHAALEVIAIPVYATANTLLTVPVGTFYADATASPSDLQARVDWGDGHNSAGTITQNSDGTFTVTGTHTYAALGQYTTTVTITPWNQNTATAKSDSASVYSRDPSLVADWEFASGPSDNGGTTFVDTSGSSNLTSASGAVFAIGPDGSPGLQFNGTSDYASVSDNTGLNPSSQITLSASINAVDWANANATILRKGDGSYSLAAANNQLVFSINTSAGVQQVSAPLPSTGVWHQLLATYDGSTIALSVDGQTYSASATGTIVSSTGPLVFGNKAASTSVADVFNGTISSASIYSKALASGSVVLPATATTPSPVIVLATPDDQSVTLTWTWSVPAGARSVAFLPLYTVTGGSRRSATPVASVVVSLTSRPGRSYSKTISDLTPGTSYTFYLAASVRGGLSKYTSATRTTPIHAPNMISVRTSGGSASLLVQGGTGALPTGQTVMWGWAGSNAPKGWKVFRTEAGVRTELTVNPSAVVYDSAKKIYSWTDPTPMPPIPEEIKQPGKAIYDPPIYSYDVVAILSDTLSPPLLSPASSKKCAPQMYLMLGGGNYDGTSVTELYDYDFGCEVHWFEYDVESTALAAMNARPSGVPLVLAGISFGGGAAVDLSWQLSAAQKPIRYLALFDPVAINLAPDPNDPPQAGDFHAGNYYSGGDQSSFKLPLGIIQDADDWWQVKGVEFPAGNYAPSGPIDNLSDAPVDGRWSSSLSGTFHTSQENQTEVIAQLKQELDIDIDWTVI